ncbi:MAG: serine/threonine-protein phosphatase [Firmicutes bacterium]|nr:serine/threonine-protein phosphatase [Bacillota bacterium]
MEVHVDVAKVGKYATGISGDSVEVVERPCGGVSVVIIDGQGHGKAAKRMSHMIATKAASLIEDGARDGAVMRVINDHLYAFRDGQVSATATLLTADLAHRCLVVSRNSNSPVVVASSGTARTVDAPVDPIGIRRLMKPSITLFDLAEETVLVGFTDGVIHAGRSLGQSRFSFDWVYKQIHRDLSARELTNVILDYAIELEDGKPRDDMVVAVMKVVNRTNVLGIRRVSVSYPF